MLGCVSLQLPFLFPSELILPKSVTVLGLLHSPLMLSLGNVSDGLVELLPVGPRGGSRRCLAHPRGDNTYDRASGQGPAGVDVPHVLIEGPDALLIDQESLAHIVEGLAAVADVVLYDGLLR